MPTFPQLLLWEAEFEIERARFGRAAALIKEAQIHRTFDTSELPERRLARLLLSAGRFAEAEKTVLGGRGWDGKDVRKLKVSSAMDLVTLGEVYSARGSFSEAIAILEKAREKAKNVASIDGLEWVRAQNDIAVANLSLGLVQEASQAAAQALSEAQRQWGSGSVPAMDALDTIGLICVSESRFDEAELSISRCRARREVLYGTVHPKVAQSVMHSALLRDTQMNRAEAVRLVSQSLEIEKTIVGGPNGRWALALVSGAEILVHNGQTADAKRCYEAAIPVLERELGHDVPRLESARKRYASLVGE